MKKVKNATGGVKTWVGQEIQPGEYYTLEVTEYNRWATNDVFLAALASNEAVMNNGSADIVGLADSIAFLQDNIAKEVVTQFEKDDKRLKMARHEAAFDVNGDATISLEIPSGGRYIAGGTAFTDAFYLGDHVTQIDLVDDNNVLGFGQGVTLASYVDTDISLGNQGWYFEPYHNNTGQIEVEPIGGYGFLIGGTFLKISAKKVSGSTATKLAVNFWWGKLE